MASRPVLARCLTAAAAGDVRALAACYAHDAVWLDDGSAHHGAAACAERHLALAAEAAAWDAPQQHGARAALRLTRRDGGRAAVVVEVRRERIVFAACCP